MGFIVRILDFYILIIFVDVILSYLPQYRFNKWALKIKKIADFTQKPIRKKLPANLPFDFSPLIVIIGINILKSILY